MVPPLPSGQVNDEGRQIADVSGLETKLLPLIEFLKGELTLAIGVLEHTKHRITLGITYAHLHPGRLLRQILRHAAKSTVHGGQQHPA